MIGIVQLNYLFYIESENYLVSPVRKRGFRKQNSVGDDMTDARSREDSYFRDTDHIPDNMEPFCGGSLLSSDTVLTSNRCNLSPFGLGIIQNLEFEVRELLLRQAGGYDIKLYHLNLDIS